MISPPFSLLYLLLPVLTAALTFALGNRMAKGVALIGSVFSFGVFAVMLNGFEPNGGVQYVFSANWISDLGISFTIGMDGISLIPLLLTALLTPIIIAAANPDYYNRQAAFFSLISLMQSGMALVFLARTAFTFYVGWEIALIPIFFITGVWGSEGRLPVTLKFFVYTLASSLFMLLGLVYVYMQTPATQTALHSDSMEAIYGLSLAPETQSWLFWALFIAFAVKAPVFPFHTWQPDTYVTSPAPGTMLLSGIMLKMGLYGMIRWLIPIVPEGVEHWGWLVLILSVIQIVYGSVIALKQYDIKRLLAYASFAHVGLMTAGIFTLTRTGLEGALVQMLSHGVTVVGLFLVVEVIYRSTGDRDVYKLSGLTQDSPALTVYFALMMLGSIAVPLTSGFVGEFMLLQSLTEFDTTLGIFAGLTVILSAAYMLRFFQSVLFGPRAEGIATLNTLGFSLNVAFIALALMVFWVGLFPMSFTSLIQPSVDAFLHQIGR